MEERKKLKSGHEIVSLTEEEQVELFKDFPPMKHGVVRLQPGGWLYYKTFLKYADKIYDFKFRSTDVVIMTFPKCGTTWTQEIVWTMRNNLDLKHPDAHQSIMLRAPFIESDFIFDIPIEGMYTLNNPFLWFFVRRCRWRNFFKGMLLEVAESSPDPRTIKTHLPFSLLPPDLIDNSKVIYVARNPFDTCMSFFHHNRILKAHDYVGNLDKFVDYFIQDSVIYCPYWEILKEAWYKRDHPNLLFIFYEEMKKEPRKHIEKIANFIQKELTEEQIDMILEHTSFSSMKQRDAFLGQPGHISFMMNEKLVKEDGGFFRKGQSGDGESTFNEDQKKRMDKWVKQHLAADFGPDFLYYRQYMQQN